MVSHPTAIRWGFQLSATGVNGDQAGELIPASDGRTFVQTEVVNNKTVQFIQHNSVGSTIGASNVFQVTYRTPTNANFGSILFHVAGNAANGSLSNLGDFVYANLVTVPLLTASTERSFTMTTRAGAFSSTAGAGTSLSVGFGRMQTTSGTAGSGLSLLSYKHGDVLVSEVGFAASAPIRTGRTYVEVTSGVNTGIALANPGTAAASVTVSFADAAGTTFGQSTVTIPANSQIAAFVSESPFNPSSRSVADARSFTFTSSVPISALAVKTRVNERGEFTMATLPVADLSVTSTAASAITHFAEGGGWSSEVLLVNTSDATATGTLQFFSSAGQPQNVSLDGQTASQFSYSVPARSSRRFRTAGLGSNATTGWIQISPTSSTQTPAAAGLLSAAVGDARSPETSVNAVRAGTAFRVPAEIFGDFAARLPGAVQSGVAIANLGTAAVTATVEATNLDGTVAASTTLSIPARGHFGQLLRDIPGLNLPSFFNGILWVSAPAGSSIAVGGLRGRYNERQFPDLILTGFPAFDESAASASELLIPQVVDGGGYSTRFLLLGVRSGGSIGTLRFTSQAGQPLQLMIR